MLDQLMLISAGFLGSLHCAGMCGPIVVVIGASAPDLRVNFARQLSYSCGRLSTYALLGSIGGFLGQRLGILSSSALNVQAVLSIFAGVFLLVQTLFIAGVLPRRESKTNGRSNTLASEFFRSALRGVDRRSSFLAGLATGLLPCGLLYSMIVLASTSQSVAIGAAMMSAFWIGTLPTMLAVGCGSSCFRNHRKGIMYFAAVCALAGVSIATIARGVFALANQEHGSHGCAQVVDAGNSAENLQIKGI